MSISHVYRGHAIVRHRPREHEVEGMTRRFETEEEAHRAVDKAIDGWVRGYESTTQTPVDTDR